MKRLLPLFATAAVVLAACSSGGGDQAGGDPIKIGLIAPLTGEAAPFGSDVRNGVTMKVDAINAAGGINGRLLELIAEDGRCNGTDAASAAQKLVNVDKVVAIIGGVCSGETLAMAPIAEAAKVVVLSPTSSSPDVTEAGDFIFRDYPSDALKSTAMAGYFQNMGFDQVAVISENTDFATAFRDALMKDVGNSIVFNETVEPGTKDFRSLMTRLKGTEFDVFFPNGQTPAAIAAMLQQFKEQGLKQPAISHDVADSATLVELAPDAVTNLRVINIDEAGKGTSFETDFVKAYGNPTQGIGFAAFAYDAAGVLADAIKEDGTDGEKIRDYLYDLEGYKGIVGEFSFDENGDVIGVPYVLREVQNGKFTTVADITVDQ